MRFKFYRLQIHHPTQLEMFNNQISHENIIRSSLKEYPEKDVRKGQTWHIGNIREENGIIEFRFGKTTKQSVEKYKSGNFIDAFEDVSPYTFIYIDIIDQVCLIGERRKLSSKIDTIKNYLVEILRNTDIFVKNKLTLEINPIPNPSSFLEIINKAYSIKKIEIEVSLPNLPSLFDYEKDFEKPVSEYIQKSNGDSGKIFVKGDMLDKDMIVETAKAAGMKGKGVKARYKSSINSKTNVITTKSEELIEEIETAEHNDLMTIKKIILQIMKTLYHG